ncbi:hypothetical protein CBW54_09495 [Yersinia kristensenii]|nr:hypothetical protein CBW54_09495 [Yersinia kristensenii]
MTQKKTDIFSLNDPATHTDNDEDVIDNDDPDLVDDAPPDVLEETTVSKRWFGLGKAECIGLAIFILFGGIYIAWPDSQGPKGAPQFVETASPSEPLRQKEWSSAYQNTAPTDMPINDAPSVIVSSYDPLTSFKKEMAAVLESRRTYAEENREAIQALSDRLDASNTQIKSLEQQLSDMAIRLESVRSQPSTPAKVSTASPPTVTKKVTRSTPQTSTSGYSINTLWQGMAWVSHQGSTYAVREGDTLGNMQIKRIDADKRQIETSAGIIR